MFGLFSTACPLLSNTISIRQFTNSHWNYCLPPPPSALPSFCSLPMLKFPIDSSIVTICHCWKINLFSPSPRHVRFGEQMPFLASAWLCSPSCCRAGRAPAGASRSPGGTGQPPARAPLPAGTPRTDPGAPLVFDSPQQRDVYATTTFHFWSLGVLDSPSCHAN